MPADVVASDPRLVLLSVWIVGEVQSRFVEMSRLLDRAEELLEAGAVVDPGVTAGLRGQIDELRGGYIHMVDADFERAIAGAQSAQRLLADQPGRNLVFAYVLGRRTDQRGPKRRSPSRQLRRRRPEVRRRTVQPAHLRNAVRRLVERQPR